MNPVEGKNECHMVLDRLPDSGKDIRWRREAWASAVTPYPGVLDLQVTDGEWVSIRVGGRVAGNNAREFVVPTDDTL